MEATPQALRGAVRRNQATGFARRRDMQCRCASGTTGGAGDLPASRQRLQHLDATTGHLDITAAPEFPEDAIDHVA